MLCDMYEEGVDEWWSGQMTSAPAEDLVTSAASVDTWREADRFLESYEVHGSRKG